MTRVSGWGRTGFAGRLRALRVGKGWTQAELAQRAGVHGTTIYRLEVEGEGGQEPAWPLVLLLAEALGVSTEAFRAVRAEGEGEVKEEKPKRPRGRPRKQVG